MSDDLTSKYISVCEKLEAIEMYIYQCCECEKEMSSKDIRVEIPEENKVLCPECFYKIHDIIK